MSFSICSDFLFQRVDGLIDVSPLNSDEMHIIFDVTEVAPAFADVETTTGDNEANLTATIGLSNTMGRADKITLGQTFGTHGSKKTEAKIRVLLRHKMFPFLHLFFC